MQIRIATADSVIAALELRALSHESAVFGQICTCNMLMRGMVFAYVNQFDTLYRVVAHFRD